MQVDQYSKQYLYRQVVKAKLFMDENYCDNINLSGISENAFFSKFHFTRLFKNIYGTTPHQYLTIVRIEKAKEYLATEMSIADICFAIGFESVSSFKGLFKRLAGSTPTQYKRNIQFRNKSLIEKPLEFIPSCVVFKNKIHKKAIFETDIDK